MRRLLVIAAGLGMILLYLLASASSNNLLFSRNYTLLIALNGLLAVLLTVFVTLQIRRLWQEYRARQFGSRLKLKLMGLFIAIAVLPGVVVYAVSIQFAVRSIESWYNVRIDKALESGLTLGRNTLESLAKQFADRARNALEWQGSRISTNNLPRLRESLNADTASVLSMQGMVMLRASASFQSVWPGTPDHFQLTQGAQLNGWYGIDNAIGGQLLLRVILPIASANQAGAPRLLQVTQRVPIDLAQNAGAVQSAYRDYQELQLARQGLKRIHALTLTLTLLLTVLAATAVAAEITQSLVAPLTILAEGTQAVAAGDLTPRQALAARTELGELTQWFNRMTKQLAEARTQAEQNRAAVEASRAYLESVLANLSAGVLAFSSTQFLRAANRGALESLGDDLTELGSVPLQQWPKHVQLRDTICERLQNASADWHQQIEIEHPDGRIQTLLLHGSRLPMSSGGGFVVVFDDISELISAQRNAAWAEVARRLAHEIKNPLTPIQLSAERLQYKLADQLDDNGRTMLNRATQTIVNQVEAMKTLVNSFRDYAKLPPPVLTALDLNALIKEILVLYEGSRVHIRANLASSLPSISGDAGQLRQVLHNLLLNAEEALTDHTNPQIEIQTQALSNTVELTLQDNGPGFSAAHLGRIFEPYVSTKLRGSGLGLAIIKKIVDEHHGQIQADNVQPQGARIRIQLPLAQNV